MSGITNLHNGMILSTLSINSSSFTFCFPKDLVPMEIEVFTCKLVIFLLISQRETISFNNPQHSVR